MLNYDRSDVVATCFEPVTWVTGGGGGLLTIREITLRPLIIMSSVRRTESTPRETTKNFNIL
jgi:hypothetical protein